MPRLSSRGFFNFKYEHYLSTAYHPVAPMSEGIPHYTFGDTALGTKYAFSAFCTLFFYDFLLTVQDEIIYIWRRRFSLDKILLPCGRYNNYFGLLVSAISSSIFFPYAVGIPMTFIPNITIALRMYALYERRWLIGLSLVVYLIAEFSVAMWIYSVPGNHPYKPAEALEDFDAFRICIDLTADRLGNLSSASFQIMQVVYDSIVFLLLFLCNIKEMGRNSWRSDLRRALATQGLIYFAVIFSANATWGIMILNAPANLKYAAALPTLLYVLLILRW
ncbi:hypothetical protein PNOK_0025600 [Pyrrhoderma noxium]|uniref:DUF6533 domain-containing protein n=1 Tax=Pyrrhoderma noxium TaxID=2282107 RepID=A0A286UUE0_9AGAM|nr:hypothetical protein PNOK_0025600 [Pyrrhoderma noxium]